MNQFIIKNYIFENVALPTKYDGNVGVKTLNSICSRAFRTVFKERLAHDLEFFGISCVGFTVEGDKFKEGHRSNQVSASAGIHELSPKLFTLLANG